MTNPVPRVIDLSHHNTVPKDFEAAKAEGIIGIIHKCTEGVGFIDSKQEARHYLAKQSGLAWGLYHFLRPGDIDAQVAHFVDTAMTLGVYDENTLMVADHEDQGVSGEELKRFLDGLEDATGRSPVVYSGHVLKEQLEGQNYTPKRRLWLCHYTTGTPTLPDGVEKYWLWQYTDQGHIADLGPVDLNDIGDAAVEDFLAGWSGAYEEQPPTPEPAPSAEVVITIEAPAGVKVTVNQKEV